MPPRQSNRARGKSPAPPVANATPRRSTRGSSRATSPSVPASTFGLDTLASRPALPLEHANDLLKKAGTKTHPVKEQTLKLERENIVIYRQKVPTPKGVSGHIIRRTDSDAVSASSMFRCAFPSSSAEAEDQEMAWLSSIYDTISAGREKDPEGMGKLTGKWVPTKDAISLAGEYGLFRFAKDLLEYVSDKPPTNGPITPSNGVTSLAVDSPGEEPSPSSLRVKRQRVASPTPASPAVTATQTVITASDGTVTETNTVVVSVPDAAALPQESSEEQQIRLVEGAKELVESLKETEVLASVSDEGARGKKRSHADIAVEDPAVKRKRGWFGSKAPKQRQIAGIASSSIGQTEAPMTPTARRTYAFAGLAVVGLATAAAPYFFG